MKERAIETLVGGLHSNSTLIAVTSLRSHLLNDRVIDWLERYGSDTPALLFRNSAFADDVAKSNLTKTLRQRGLDNVRSL
jgi:adenine-specific DNA-methyltransferase